MNQDINAKSTEDSNTRNQTTVNFVISENDLKEVLVLMYHNLTTISSDGLSQMRKNIPILYSKHSIERGKRISQHERNLKNLSDECYSYGEINFDIFSTILLKVIDTFGEHSNGIFCDLGCGVGSIVYTTSFICNNLTKCIGIEYLENLFIRGDKRLTRWNRLKEYFPNKQKSIEFEFHNLDFFSETFWTDSTIIFLHWTAFSKSQRLKLASIINDCKEGTMVISVTHPVPIDDFHILIRDKCETSWGQAEYFVQEKIIT